MRRHRLFIAAAVVAVVLSAGPGGANTVRTIPARPAPAGNAPTISPTAPLVPGPCGGPLEPACVPQAAGPSTPTGGLIGLLNKVKP